MNCPHCHKPIETKKSLRKRIAELEAEVTQLKLAKITGPKLPSPIWIIPQVTEPKPYVPTWPDPYGPTWAGDSIVYFAGCRAQN